MTDHYLPTINRSLGTAGMTNPEIRRVVEMLDENSAEFKLPHVGWFHSDQGIAHVISPELAISQPGMLITCNDSHTATNGACGALAVPIGGGNQLRHVIDQQVPAWLGKLKTLRMVIIGSLPVAATAKDVILSIIHEIGVGGATGYAVEYAGSAIRAMSMEGRLTVCNMSIEGGARIGMVGPDDTTYQDPSGRRYAPQGKDSDAALMHWRTLPTNDGAVFDRELHFDAGRLAPMVSGARARKIVRRSMAPFPTPRTSPMSSGGAMLSARSIICGSRRRRRLSRLRSIGSSSVRAPIAASRICALRRTCLKAAAPPCPVWSRRGQAR